MESEKVQNVFAKEVKEGFDSFNGVVAIFENPSWVDEPQRFWVEHQRKDIYTDYLTIEEAEATFNEFVNDTMFN